MRKSRCFDEIVRRTAFRFSLALSVCLQRLQGLEHQTRQIREVKRCLFIFQFGEPDRELLQKCLCYKNRYLRMQNVFLRRFTVTRISSLDFRFYNISRIRIGTLQFCFSLSLEKREREKIANASCSSVFSVEYF